MFTAGVPDDFDATKLNKTGFPNVSNIYSTFSSLFQVYLLLRVAGV